MWPDNLLTSPQGRNVQVEYMPRSQVALSLKQGYIRSFHEGGRCRPTRSAAATKSCREGPSTSMPTDAAMTPTASVARTRQRSMSGCRA